MRLELLMVDLVAIGSRESSVLSSNSSNLKSSHDKLALKIDEACESTCVTEKTRCWVSRMFWGSYFGREKGLYFFWEKEWGSINVDSYLERVVPLVANVVFWNPDSMWLRIMLFLIRQITRCVNYTGISISPIKWPPYYPNLNPIESLWNSMKDYSLRHYPELD